MGFAYNGLRGVPKADYKGPKMRATANEFRNMAMAGRLWAACSEKLGKMLESRLRQHPGAWRDWRSGVALLGRAMDIVFQTVPDDQFERLDAVFSRSTIKIDMPMASDDRRGVVGVHADDLVTLTYYAMRAECAICLREGGQVRTCGLGKALAGVREPDTWETSGCAWRDQILREMSEA